MFGCPSCGGCADDCSCSSGAERERVAIVEWLRNESAEAGHVMRQHALKLAADEIERGEHWKTTPTGSDAEGSKR